MGRSANDALIGRTIAGKFLVEEMIGEGGMGAVFRARQIALEKTIAIKVLHGEHADDPAFVARFQREAKAASRLNHPNSMQVIDFGAEPDGLLYIAMEFLDGRTLHRVLRDDGPLPPARIADILMQTLAALAVAHDMGVVHRDLKPDNIMILSRTDDDGRPRDVVKVCDFGIAKITDPRAFRDGKRSSDAPVTTSAGLMVGTPEYMSPEQGRGQKLDARSDLYSVGVILFQMLTGRVPFEAENAIGTVLMHINEAPTRPSEMSPGVDSRLEAVCLRALRKAPAERFADAREMRAELRAVVDSPELVPAGAPRQEMLAETTRPPRPEEATATQEAPVVAVPAAPVSRGSLDVAKPTLAGTTSAVPGPRKRARAAVVLAGAALALGVAGALVILPRGHRATAAATPAPPIENGTAAGAPSPAPGRDTPAPSMDRASAPAPTRPDSSPKPPGKGAAIAAPPGRATTSGPSAASAASAAAPPTPSATPSPAPSVAQAAPPPSAAPTASATPAAPPPDPSFDPDRGVVEIGLVNGTGVSDRPVRAALQGAGLTSCYRTALRAKGSRATAIATLNLSIDGSGAVRTAVVIGADILPGLTRCIQGAAQGQHLAASQVAPGGASAEVWLSFKVP